MCRSEYLFDKKELPMSKSCDECNRFKFRQINGSQNVKSTPPSLSSWYWDISNKFKQSARCVSFQIYVVRGLVVLHLMR